MKTFFIGKDFWEIVESGYEEPTDWNTLQPNDRRLKKEVEKKNAMPLFHIQMALEKSLFPRIVDAQTTKEVWMTLKDACHGNYHIKVVKLQTLKREYENLKMKETQNVGDFCVIVKDVTHKMATLGEPMTQEHVTQKVLSSLSPRWTTLAIVMEESKNLATMEYDELVGSLI